MDFSFISGIDFGEITVLYLVYIVQDKHKSLKKMFADYYSFYIHLGIFFERIIFNLSNIELFRERLVHLIESLEKEESLIVYSNFPTILELKEIPEKISGSPVNSIYLSNEYTSFFSFTSHFDESISSIKEEFRYIIQKNDSDVKHCTTSLEGANLQEAIKSIRLNTISGLKGCIIMIDSLIDIIKEKRLHQFAAAKIYLEKILDRRYRINYFSYNLWKFEGLSLKYFKSKSDISKYNDYENIYKRIHNHFDSKIHKSVHEILEDQ